MDGKQSTDPQRSAVLSVRDLAYELRCTPGEVLTQLAVMHILALGADSRVRDEDAEAVRQALRKRSGTPLSETDETATDAQLRALREKLGGSASNQSSPTASTNEISFSEDLRRVRAKHAGRKSKSKNKHWYPDNEPLTPLVATIADRVVPVYQRSTRKPPGMIYNSELETINRVHMDWVRARVVSGCLMEDDEIISWLKKFPDQPLDPDTVIALAQEGITPWDAALRLWYGKINENRPTVFDRICFKDITVRQAKAEIEQYKHAG
ncbi:hypothetical protein ACTJJE_11840 [Mycolicibacterium sp. 22603]|uniref:hypothetical protein n=1 Tax=Mycolicibacterium sp. 22603 TaxID=3453950 RepID=UPI003F8278B2